ncbi:MAG: D-hexose-6-phosphate mutarotase [Planctomycetota bacterium]|nr:D-hexose-6-phosphate mutarotase [Planctomycetota bacterium]
MPQSLEQLNTQFALPGLLQFESGQGGLTRVAITTPHAEAQVYLHGAHVTSFVQSGKPPMLFLSGKSWFEDGKPIRGGVPLVFPWFGAHPDRAELPAHGFARLKAWEVESVARGPRGGVTITLLTRHDDKTLAAWPHRFELRHRVSVVPDEKTGEPAALVMELSTRNAGDQPMPFEEALHTYLHVGDVRQAKVTGLDGVSYTARNEGGAARTQSGPVTFTGETDRLYQGTAGTCELDDPALGRKIVVSKTGSLSTVVWNPWIDKAKAMVDFGDEEWPGMACIETANAREQTVTLPPGKTHTMTATLR